MTIDVATDAGAPEQRYVVMASEQADVIDLRYAGREELDRAREQIVTVDARERVVEGAVDLVKVEV